MIKLCEFKDIGGGKIECVSCGRTLVGDSEMTVANCRGGGGGKMPEPKLGDMLEEFLSGVGITKEGYRRAKEVFGMPPTCNCEKRKKWLNDVSDWWRKKKSKKISK